MKRGGVDIKVTLHSRAPFTKGARRIPFEKIARDVLGSGYHLSLVICGDKLAQRINKEYRKRSYYANVLSFGLAKNEGEIFLNLRKAAREAREFRVSLLERAALLFVHGLFHLKGMDHGKRMEREEERVLRKYRLQ